MPLFRTPVVDKAQPIVILEGEFAGCITPYFQRVLLSISEGSNAGLSVAGGDLGPLFAAKVDKDTSTGWGNVTGTKSKAVFATYAAPVVSNPPTQAEMQALANHAQLLSQHLAAALDALKTAQVISA